MTNKPPEAEDGGHLFSPGLHRIHFPHLAIPNWVSLSPYVDARALGVYGHLRAHVNESTGQWVADLTAAELGERFGLSRQAIDRAPNPNNTGLSGRGGVIQRLAEAGAVTRHRRWTKSRDCQGCGTPRAVQCPMECTETTGRVRAAPEYRIASAPPQGQAYMGPLHLGEYKHPEIVLERLAAVAQLQGPGQELYPFGYAMTWVVLHPEMSAIDVAVYLFLCAHTSLSQGRMEATVLRERVCDRLDLNPSRMSAATALLERIGAITKRGLHTAITGRRVGNKRAVSYVVQVAPPKEMWHPHALDIGEWRDPSLVRQRLMFQALERVRSRQERHGGRDTTPLPDIGAGQGGVDSSFPQVDGGSGHLDEGRPVDNPGDVTPRHGVVPGQDGHDPSYPQAGSGSDSESDIKPVDNSPHEPHERGYPQVSLPGDVTPDLGIVDNSGGDGASNGHGPQARGGLHHWDEGVTSLGRDITRYLLTTYGGAVPSVDGHPQGRAQALREIWSIAWDVVAVALEQLPGSASPLRSSRDHQDLVASVADRLVEGYTPVELGQALTVSTAGVRSAWALTVRAADPSRWLGRPVPQVPAGAVVSVPWCGRCEADTFRFVADGDRVRRCGDCHPNSERPWMAS